MKTLTAHGVELSLIDRGTGMPVVLVHGFPLDHAMWNAQLDALAANHRVIVPDLRGFGQSSLTGKLETDQDGTADRVVTMEQLADDLAAMLDALAVDEPVALCGLSMGGYVALHFQRKYAERLRALILADTRALNDTPETAAARREMADRVLREGPAPLVDGMMPRLFAESTVRERPEIVESLRRIMLRTDPRGIAAAARGMARRPDTTGWLGEIGCPTLVVVGEFDAISPPEEMRDMARAIPGATFVEIAGSGHMSPMEAPEEFNAALLRQLEE